MLRGECLPKRRTAYFLDCSVYYVDKDWPASKLSGALWRRGEKRKESLQLLLWNLNSASPSPVGGGGGGGGCGVGVCSAC